MTTTDQSATGPRVRSLRIDASAVVIAVVLLPLVVTFVALLGTHWHPSSDNALEILRIRDVGGRHTPLVGVQSRFGWDHPGPWLFWVLAPFRWVAGDTAVLVGVLCVNAAAITGALLLARRRGGTACTCIVACALLLLMRGMEPRLLMDPWNPWIAVLPFAAYLMLCWSLAERDAPTLPWLVGVGSFLIQTHVGYTPLVVGAAATAIVVRLALHRKPDASTPRRWWGLAAGVGFVMWLPPVVQQFTGDGNLTEIVDAFRHPDEALVGLANSLGFMGTELGHRAPWITGNDTNILGFVRPASVWPAWVVLALTVGLGALAARRGAKRALRFALVLVGTALFGVLAGARIIGVPGNYLLRWWWVIAALLWASIVFSGWSLLEAHVPRRVAAGVAGVALVALVLVVTADTLPVRVPEASYSSAIAELVPTTEAHLRKDQRYYVTWLGLRDLGAVGVGTYLALLDEGYDVKVADRYRSAYGKWRVGTPETSDATITIVASDEIDKGWTPPPNSSRVATYDSLDPGARARADELAREIGALGQNPTDVDFALFWPRLRDAGVEQKMIDELLALRDQGQDYSVYVTPS